MKNFHQKIEVASNIAIIVVALLLGGVLVNRYFFSSAAQPASLESKEIKVGAKLPIADIDWSGSDKTLVLALSTVCRYCTESAPFYQKLAGQRAERGEVRLVVVTPQSVDEARRYLSEHNVAVDEIRQASLNSINVRGTPTIITADKNGAVTRSWTGKLPPEKETEVMKYVFGEDSGD